MAATEAAAAAEAPRRAEAPAVMSTVSETDEGDDDVPALEEVRGDVRSDSPSTFGDTITNFFSWLAPSSTTRNAAADN